MDSGHLRKLSPPLVFSSLITSAPQSAIIRPQLAEATIRDNSTTLMPFNGLYCSICIPPLHYFLYFLVLCLYNNNPEGEILWNGLRK